MAKSKAAPAPAQIAKPEYYPPTAHLNDEHMGKLGVKDMPKIGDKMPFHGRVTGVQERSDGSRSIELELEKMVDDAEKKASEQDIHEGKLKGAKAAMDQALDKQEGEKKAKSKR